ncbi:MAG: hypothetical protein U0Q21_00510 [Dermatophilaceae bacterium]
MEAGTQRSGGAGFPTIAGYVVRERCDDDAAGAWFRGHSVDGEPVLIRVLTAPAGPPPASPQGGGRRAPVAREVVGLRQGGLAFVYDDPGLVSLADVLAHGGLLTPGQTVGLCLGVRDALAGLDAAHGQIGLATVLLDGDGRVWVGDVGVAMARGVVAARHTDAVALARVALLALSGRGSDAVTADTADGTDPGASMRRVLADAVVDAGSTGTVDAVADSIRPYAAPSALAIPPHLLPSRSLDLAARMRALAGEPPEHIDLADGRFRATLRWPGRTSVRGNGRTAVGTGPRGRTPSSVGSESRMLPVRGRARGPRESLATMPPIVSGPPLRHGPGGRSDSATPGPRAPLTRASTQNRSRRPDLHGVLDRLRDNGLDNRRGLLVGIAGLLGCVAVAVAVMSSGGSDVDQAPGSTEGVTAAATSSGGASGQVRAQVPPAASPVTTRAATKPSQSGGAGASSTSAGPGSSAEQVAPVFDPTSPATRAAGLAQDLADLRSQAWAGLDVEAIGRLDADGSPAESADLTALKDARTKGLRYDGLEFLVTSATATDLTTRAGEEASLIALDVRMDVSAYAIRRDKGAGTQVPELLDQRVRLILAWSGERWQVSRVDQA